MRAFGYNNMERSKIFKKGKVSERFDFQANTREKVTLKTDVVCVVDGGWGAWATWSHCSKTCGSGVESRARSCDSPTPSGGGQPCVGDTTETRTCNLGICASKINIYPFIQWVKLFSAWNILIKMQVKLSP